MLQYLQQSVAISPFQCLEVRDDVAVDVENFVAAQRDDVAAL